MDVIIKLPHDVAKALQSALYTPSTDREGHAIYAINVNLACEVRRVLADALEAK